MHFAGSTPLISKCSSSSYVKPLSSAHSIRCQWLWTMLSEPSMSAGLKKEGCYQHVSLLACYLISILIVSCLNHFNNIISACFHKYTLFLVQALIFLDKKRTAIVLLSFRRRYFTMGIVKIYNVLGGFYVNYSITCSQKCLLSWCTNMHKFSIIFYAICILSI